MISQTGKLFSNLFCVVFLTLGLIDCQSIRGIPGVDYPNYSEIPKTEFQCSEQLSPGFYADPETRCQVFHYCFEHRRESFLCPSGTIFNQAILACDYWYSAKCSSTNSYYSVHDNEEHHDEEIPAGIVYDTIDYKSGELFDKMESLYNEGNKSIHLNDSLPVGPDAITDNENGMEQDAIMDNGNGTVSNQVDESVNFASKQSDYVSYDDVNEEDKKVELPENINIFDMFGSVSMKDKREFYKYSADDNDIDFSDNDGSGEDIHLENIFTNSKSDRMPYEIESPVDEINVNEMRATHEPVNEHDSTKFPHNVYDEKSPSVLKGENTGYNLHQSNFYNHEQLNNDQYDYKMIPESTHTEDISHELSESRGYADDHSYLELSNELHDPGFHHEMHEYKHIDELHGPYFTHEKHDPERVQVLHESELVNEYDKTEISHEFYEEESSHPYHKADLTDEYYEAQPTHDYHEVELTHEYHEVEPTVYHPEEETTDVYDESETTDWYHEAEVTEEHHKAESTREHHEAKQTIFHETDTSAYPEEGSSEHHEVELNHEYLAVESNQGYDEIDLNQEYQEADPNQEYHEANPNQEYHGANPNQEYHEADPNQEYHEADPNQEYHEADPNQEYHEADPNQEYHEADPNQEYHEADLNQEYHEADLNLEYHEAGPNHKYNEANPNHEYNEEPNEYREAGPNEHHVAEPNYHHEIGPNDYHKAGSNVYYEAAPNVYHETGLNEYHEIDLNHEYNEVEPNEYHETKIDFTNHEYHKTVPSHNNYKAERMLKQFVETEGDQVYSELQPIYDHKEPKQDISHEFHESELSKAYKNSDNYVHESHHSISDEETQSEYELKQKLQGKYLVPSNLFDHGFDEVLVKEQLVKESSLSDEDFYFEGSGNTEGDNSEYYSKISKRISEADKISRRGKRLPLRRPEYIEIDTTTEMLYLPTVRPKRRRDHFKGIIKDQETTAIPTITTIDTSTFAPTSSADMDQSSENVYIDTNLENITNTEEHATLDNHTRFDAFKENRSQDFNTIKKKNSKTKENIIFLNESNNLDSKHSVHEEYVNTETSTQLPQAHEVYTEYFEHILSTEPESSTKNIPVEIYQYRNNPQSENEYYAEDESNMIENSSAEEDSGNDLEYVQTDYEAYSSSHPSFEELNMIENDFTYSDGEYVAVAEDDSIHTENVHSEGYEMDIDEEFVEMSDQVEEQKRPNRPKLHYSAYDDNENAYKNVHHKQALSEVYETYNQQALSEVYETDNQQALSEVYETDNQQALSEVYETDKEIESTNADASDDQIDVADPNILSNSETNPINVLEDFPVQNVLVNSHDMYRNIEKDLVEFPNTNMHLSQPTPNVVGTVNQATAMKVSNTLQGKKQTASIKNASQFQARPVSNYRTFLADTSTGFISNIASLDTVDAPIPTFNSVFSVKTGKAIKSKKMSKLLWVGKYLLSMKRSKLNVLKRFIPM